MIAEHYLGKLSDRVEAVTVVESVKGMRAALDSGGIDIVLLDLTLPDSSLEKTLGALDALRQEYGPKFVAMSSLGDEEIAQRALNGGATAFLPKNAMGSEALSDVLDQVHPVVLMDAPSDTRTSREQTPANQKPVAVDAAPLDAAALGSKIAHDALGWVANVSFRATHLAADPAVQGSAALMKDVSSLRTSADALSSFISGSLKLLKNELVGQDRIEEAETAPELIELKHWLPDFVARWKKSSRDKQLTVRADALSDVQVRGPLGGRALSQCLTAFLQNVRDHGNCEDGPVLVTIAEEPASGRFATLIITDEGGPWSLSDARLLGTPLGTGEQNAPSAGLGLFNARRTIESLGGALTFFERPDSPGAYGLRLVLPKS